MAARPRIAASVFSLRRAVSMMVMKISRIRNAVPKSGCLAISSAGALTITTGIARWRKERPSSAGESFRYLPSATMVSTCIISDGCTWNGPRSNQRRPPPTILPNASTPTSSATPVAVEDVAEAADGAVVEAGDGQEDHRAQRQPGDLLREQVRLAIVDGAPQVHQAQRGHGRRRRGQRPVEAEAQLAPGDHARHGATAPPRWRVAPARAGRLGRRRAPRPPARRGARPGRVRRAASRPRPAVRPFRPGPAPSPPGWRGRPRWGAFF